MYEDVIKKIEERWNSAEAYTLTREQVVADMTTLLYMVVPDMQSTIKGLEYELKHHEGLAADRYYDGRAGG